MKITSNADHSLVEDWRLNGRVLLATALVFFIAGSLFTAQFRPIRGVRANRPRSVPIAIRGSTFQGPPGAESLLSRWEPAAQPSRIFGYGFK